MFCVFGGWGRGCRIREGLSNRFLTLGPRIVLKPVPDEILKVYGVLAVRVGTVGLGLLGLLAGEGVRPVRHLVHRIADDMCLSVVGTKCRRPGLGGLSDLTGDYLGAVEGECWVFRVGGDEVVLLEDWRE